MRTDQQMRADFLGRLANMPESGQRHLLRIESVAELRFLQIYAKGTTKRIIDEMLAAADAKFNELGQRLGY